MEDLGHIDINVNETGRSNGEPGGGPDSKGMVSNLISKLTGATKESFGGLMSKGESIGSALGGLKDFAAAPSVAGFGEMTEMATEAGVAIAELGAVGVATGGALVAVIVAAGLAAAGLYLMHKAAEAVQERIAAVSKYSGVLTAATTAERVAELNRKFKEAAQNGAAYAQAQKAATRANDSWANMVMAWNRSLASVAVVWHELVAIFAKVATPFIKAGASMLEWTFKALLEIVRYIAKQLGILIDNTEPEPDTSSINEWFRADIVAMTGRPY